MGVEKLDHYLVRAADLERTVKFYEDALGLHAGYRPPFQFPGAWMYAAPQPGAADGQAIVHLAGTAPGDTAATTQYLGGRDGQAGSGAVDHIAFVASGIADMRARLDRHGIAYRERRVPDLGLRQLFIHDPDGVKIELNYSHPDDLA